MGILDRLGGGGGGGRREVVEGLRVGWRGGGVGESSSHEDLSSLLL